MRSIIDWMRSFWFTSVINIKITESYFVERSSSLDGTNGLIDIFNLSMINTGEKVFYPNKWSIKIKYQNGEIHNVSTFVAKDIFMVGKDFQGNQLVSRLKVEDIKYIQNYPIISPGQLVTGYLILRDNNYSSQQKIDSILITLVDFSGEIKI